MPARLLVHRAVARQDASRERVSRKTPATRTSAAQASASRAGAPRRPVVRCVVGEGAGDQNVIGSRNSRLTRPRTLHALALLSAGRATASVPRTSRFDPRSAKPPLVRKLTSTTPSVEPGAVRPTANELKPSSVWPWFAGSFGSAGHGTNPDPLGWTQLLGTWTVHTSPLSVRSLSSCTPVAACSGEILKMFSDPVPTESLVVTYTMLPSGCSWK